jgi:hypothetical protein
MKEHIFKYEVTVYHNYTGDERVYKEVVYATSFANATKKVVTAFTFKGVANSTYDMDVCDIKIAEYLDEGGEHTDIYVFNEEEK